MNFYKQKALILFCVIFFLGAFAPMHAKHGKHKSKTKCFSHNIQLQLSDSLGFPVPGTEFWVTLDIIKDGPLVTIQIPLINFQTGQSAQAPQEPTPLIAGGYLYTADGFLPEEIRPASLVPHAVLAASNNGLSPVFSFTQEPATLPTPPVGYIVEITNAGALVVQCAGTFGNIIPSGPQTILPTTISYIAHSPKKLCKNYKLSNGFTDTTQFTDPAAASSALRDSHFNDAHAGVSGWAWCDNSMVADKTNGTLNLMVAIGHTSKKGKLKIGAAQQLTDFGPGIMAWDTAVAINRTDKDNIVVSYGYIDNNTGSSALFSAVSFDGGVTWPQNGPLNIQPEGGFGDVCGVIADKYGNFWYCANAFGVLYIPAVLYVSSDKGRTYQLAYTSPAPTGVQTYDFPQTCFGADGDGNYGIYLQSTLLDPVSGDQTPTLAFIPITGLGEFGASEFTELPELINSCAQSDLTGSATGKLWLQGVPNYARAFSYISPITLSFKSPGPLGQNYAGSWDTIILNNSAFQYAITNVISQPVKGYIYHAAQSILYDEKRQALYAISAAQVPDYSQNMRIFFIISRDNGQTWSTPIDISNSNIGNRGFQSMILDDVTGDLLFGWYDGRNDQTHKSLEYFAGIITAQKLDKLVNALPPSNPLYIVPMPI